MNDIENKSKRSEDLKAVILLVGLLGGFLTIWLSVEHFIFNSLTPEGQMKIYSEFLETFELECVIETGVPNNIYTGEITVESYDVITSPYLMIGGHDMNEDQKMEVAQVLIQKIERMPCYPEFLQLVGYDSISKYLEGRL